jgi:methyl-accepting chemotaxis protein
MLNPRKKFTFIVTTSRSLRILTWVLSLILMVACYYTKYSVSQERQAMDNKIELVRLGYILGDASDFLTTSARKYVITLNPKYLKEYWHEINIAKRREMVLNRLTQLDTNRQELELLEKAKQNSDALLKTEIKGMKLILSALNVPLDAMPPEVRAYKLNPSETDLPAKEKVNLARKIMFDDNYSKYKTEVMQPIAKFQRKLRDRTSHGVEMANSRTNKALIVIMVLSAIIPILMFMLIWLYHTGKIVSSQLYENNN